MIGASEKCKSTETRITWNQQGPQGDQGLPGPGAAFKFQAWATGHPGEHIVFTDANEGEDVTILTMDRPNGGAPPWDKTIVIANVELPATG